MPWCQAYHVKLELEEQDDVPFEFYTPAAHPQHTHTQSKHSGHARRPLESSRHKKEKKTKRDRKKLCSTSTVAAAAVSQSFYAAGSPRACNQDCPVSYEPLPHFSLLFFFLFFFSSEWCCQLPQKMQSYLKFMTGMHPPSFNRKGISFQSGDGDFPP